MYIWSVKQRKREEPSGLTGKIKARNRKNNGTRERHAASGIADSGNRLTLGRRRSHPASSLFISVSGRPCRHYLPTESFTAANSIGRPLCILNCNATWGEGVLSLKMRNVKGYGTMTTQSCINQR